MVTRCTLGIPCFIWQPISQLLYYLNPLLTALVVMLLLWFVVKGVIRRVV